MAEICVQCGDVGYKKKLIYCFKCTQSARHSYCMDELLPKSKRQTFRWLCEDCQSNSSSGSSSSSSQSSSGGSSSIHSNNNNNNNEFVAAGITNPKPSPAEEKEEEPVIVYAEPMIISVWAGTFHMKPNNDRSSSTKRMEGVHAFLSSKACARVRETFDLFGDELPLEVVARTSVWPKSFVDGMGPTDEHIGVYFFPLFGKQEEYNRLVWEMCRGDLAMRCYVPGAGDVQLLVFPSTELPQRAWSFQGKLYLWGVFKGKLL